jgi:CRISPR system Cascade subunit CasB
LSFEEEGEPRQILKQWWDLLQDCRGDRAMLRRCAHPVEVAFCPAYHRLRSRLIEKAGPVWDDSLCLVAGLAAHIRELDVSSPFAAQSATPRGNSTKAPLSETRFRRILKADSTDDRYRFLIRVVRLLDNRCNMFSLADGVYHWNDTVRRNWAISYYERATTLQSK